MPDDAKQATQFQHWKPRWFDRFRTYLLSANIQLGLQLAAGVFVVALFTFVRPMNIPLACLAATLFFVVMVMMSIDNHIGTRIFAACCLVGPVWLGAIIAGCVGSLAKLAGSGVSYTVALCLLGPAVMPVLVICRVAAQPPYLWAMGMISCLVYGLTLITGRAAFPIDRFWGSTVAFVLVVALLSAGVAVLASLLVLPTLATDEVVSIVGRVLRSAGHHTSQYAAHLFVPSGHSTVFTDAAKLRKQSLSHMSKSSGDFKTHVRDDDHQYCDLDNANEECMLTWLELVTQPDGVMAATHALNKSSRTSDSRSSKNDLKVFPEQPDAGGEVDLTPPPTSPDVPTSAALRPPLSRARMALVSARHEPPCLRSYPFNPDAWAGLITATELLITRLSALEAVVEDGQLLNEHSTCAPQFVHAFRAIYAQLGAALARLADTVSAPKSQNEDQFCSCYVLFGRTWNQARAELKAQMITVIEEHLTNIRAGIALEHSKMPATAQARTMMYTWTLTNGVIEAVEALERAAAKAICGPAYDTNPIPNSNSGAGAASGPVPWLSPAVKYQLGWLIGLIPILLNVPLFVSMKAALFSRLPAALSSRKDFVAMLQGPMFQAGVKYWLALTVILVATVATMSAEPHAQALAPVFGYVVAALTMSERVEATVSKVVFWLAGTLIGGALGYVVMLKEPLATNAPALMAIICTYAFMVGLLGQTQFRVAITLTLMTMGALVLCQYKGCCGAGTVDYFTARVLSVSLGAIFATIVCNAILPWYTTDWALERMAGAYKNAANLGLHMYDVFYQEGFRANQEYKQQHRDPLQPDSIQATQQPNQNCVDAQAGDAVVKAAIQLPEPLGAAAVPPVTPQALQAQLAAPLVAVQMSLAKDSVFWKRGILATPQVVHQVLYGMLSLLDRMAAMQMTLRGPSVMGHFTGAIFETYLEPLHEEWRAIFATLQHMADAVALHLRKPSAESAQYVQQQIDVLAKQRTSIRQHQAAVRRQLHARIAKDVSTEDLERLHTPDDVVRYFSFQFAYIKMCDRATAVARSVLQSKCQCRDSLSSWLK
eukprot:jgi/Chrzof1/570/Cz01g20240.t1